LFKRSRDEIIGAKVEELYAKEDSEKIRNALEESKEIGFSSCKVTCIRGDNTAFPALLNFAPINDEEGNIPNILVTATDITELRKREEELNKAISAFGAVLSKAATGDLSAEVELNAIGEEYRVIGENINSMIEATGKNITEIENARAFSDLIINTDMNAMCVVDNEGRWLKANPAWERIVGYTMEELLEKRTEEQPFVTQETMKILKEELWKTVYEAGKALFVELPFLHKDGKEVTVLSSEALLKDAEGNDIGRLFVCSDITELKDKEKEIRETKEYLERETAKIADGMKELAKGDLTVKVEKAREDEIGELIEDLNFTTEILSDLLSEVHSSMQEVASIGEECAASTKQVNSGMQQVSSASQQVSTGAQETSLTVREAAKELKETDMVFQLMQSSVEESHKFAVEGVKNANEVKELSKNTTKGMEDVQTAMKNTQNTVEKLSGAVDQIGSITKVIKDIADQTNLLALNAAIKAARAGEYGRGFSVVAEEVRKLAEQSKQSTLDIGAMIKSVQKETEVLVKGANDVAEKTTTGSDTLDKTLEAVENIVTMIEETRNRMQGIADGARRGVESIEKISKGVDEIASTAEESASSAEETSSATEEQTAAIEQLTSGMENLSELSENAMKMLAKFKLQK
jgi:methyl-accepting chemotaxis protein